MATFRIQAQTVIPTTCKVVVDGKSMLEVLGKARIALRQGVSCMAGRQEVLGASCDLQDIKFRVQKTVGSSHDVHVSGLLPVTSVYEIEAVDIETARSMPVGQERVFKYGTQSLWDLGVYKGLDILPTATPAISYGSADLNIGPSSGLNTYVQKNSGLEIVIAGYPEDLADPTGTVTMKYGNGTVVGTAEFVSQDGYSTATFIWATPNGWETASGVYFDYSGDVNYAPKTYTYGDITATPYNVQFTGFTATPVNGSDITSGDTVQISGSLIYNPSTTDNTPPDLPAGTFHIQWAGQEIQVVDPGTTYASGSGKSTVRTFSFTTSSIVGDPGENTLSVIWRDDSSTNYNDGTQNVTYTVV